MVVKMMKWRPWPPLVSRKFHVNLVVQSLQGLSLAEDEDPQSQLTVEIKWKGPKPPKLSSPFRRSIKRNCTAQQSMGENGIVEWNEDFDHVCVLTMLKENVFHPWDVAFSVIHGLGQESKSKRSIVGTASLNLGEFASSVENAKQITKVPVSSSIGGMTPEAALSVTLNFMELRTDQAGLDPIDRTMAPPSCNGGPPSSEKEELSALKAGLRKVKIFREYVAVGRSKKACREEDGSDGRLSARSEECEYVDVFDTDSFEDCDDDEIEDKDGSSFRKSFSYGTLAAANRIEGALYMDCGDNEDGEDWACNYKARLESSSRLTEEPSSSDSDHALVQQPSMRSLLSWKKRKLSFRSPRARGEPLLNKAYGEEGGDDIDFDRRQLHNPAELLPLAGTCIPLQWHKDEHGAKQSISGGLDFGDDHFTVGSWEQKDLVSRDGQMKLSAQVFFASIDQRSEQAAGESACTALVAVIADWLHKDPNSMPNKSQFDSLIREGSLEWRNLCEVEAYRERFPDRHFDLDTVLQAKVRPLSVAPGKSFIGFFKPEGMKDSFEFLQGAMSFDNIWEEITNASNGDAQNLEPQIYVVSWNDHFFVLKVEKEAYYIIDTLGERLFEGCNQAYVLKFDRETTMYQLPEEEKSEKKSSTTLQKTSTTLQPGTTDVSKSVPAESSKPAPTENGSHQKPESVGDKVENTTVPESLGNKDNKEKLVCKGKESCKEFIKSFLAAIPLRELQIDVRKGLMARTPLHHRLQIEFHFTVHQCTTSTDLAVG